MPQIKEQEKSPEEELNKIKAINLPDTEFKTMRMLKQLSENFNSINKDIETLKNNQSEVINTLTEMNTLQGITSRVDKAEDQISDWEDKEAENTQSEQLKEKKNESLWGNIKCTTICIMGYQKEKRGSKELKTAF